MENADIVKSEQPNNPLARAIIANDDGIIFSFRCHICKSQFRNQIETMFDQNTPLNVIKKFLDDNGEKYQPWRIRNHFEKHYKNLQQQAAIAEYRDRLDSVLKLRRDMVEDSVARVEILWIELADALVIETGNDIDSKLKRIRIICDLEDQISKKWEFIKSLHDSEAKARALEERFEKIWNVRIESAKSPEERKILITTLKEFQDKQHQVG